MARFFPTNEIRVIREIFSCIPSVKVTAWLQHTTKYCQSLIEHVTLKQRMKHAISPLLVKQRTFEDIVRNFAKQ